MWESIERFDSRIERGIEGKSVKEQIVVRESIEDLIIGLN